MQTMFQPEIIAEAGSNHNGSQERAMALIDVAASAGASSVKFQFIFPEGLYVPEFYDGSRYVKNPAFEARKKEEMSEADWSAIWRHARSRNIDISASVFCERGVSLLLKLGAPYVKIASTDLTNHELIGQACSAFENVILSTGMATLAEIDATVRFVRSNFPATNLRLMHCVSAYPCPLSSANVQRVALLESCFGLPVGYSDHTAGEVSAAMALTQGATFFEKHFTTDRSLPGFDHAHALEGTELDSYIDTLRTACQGWQSESNTSGVQESVTKIRARRGVYAAADLPEGHILERKDLMFVRPSSDFAGNDLSGLIGAPLLQSVRRYEPLVAGNGVGRGESNWKQASDYWKGEMQEKGMDD